MPRPQIKRSDIRFPDRGSPVHNGKCGESYADALEVNVGYRGHAEKPVGLPSRGITTGKGWSPEKATQAAAALYAAEKMFVGHDPDAPIRLVPEGFLDDGATLEGVIPIADTANFQAIENSLATSRAYLEAATMLWNFWAQEWRPVFVKEVTPGRNWGKSYIEPRLPHWPLNMSPGASFGPNCISASGTFVAFGDVWRAEVKCPSSAARSMHEGDRERFADLVRAGMTWARCAEEALAALASYYLNRADWVEKTSGGFAPPKPEEPEVPPPMAFDPGPAPPPFEPGAGLQFQVTQMPMPQQPAEPNPIPALSHPQSFGNGDGDGDGDGFGEGIGDTEPDLGGDGDGDGDGEVELTPEEGFPIAGGLAALGLIFVLASKK